MENITLTLVDTVDGVGSAGDRVTLALTPTDVHDPSELPTYLAGFHPFEFRGDQASPVALVDRDEDKFRNFNSDDAFEDVVAKGSTQGAVPEVDPKSALTTYKVVERYLGAFIPKQTQDNASNPNFDPIMTAGRRVRWGLQLAREIDVWGLLGVAASRDVAVRTAVAGGSEWDVAGSDPIKDLQDAIEKSFQPITEIWMNQKVAHAFLRNDSVRDHMRQMLGDSQPGNQVRDVAQAGSKTSPRVDFQIPGLPPIKVAAAKRKVSGALNFILPDVTVLATTTPGDFPTSGEEIQSSTTFRRRGPSGVGMEVREFFVNARGPLGGTMVVVSMADIAVMTANTAGGIITNVHT